MKDFNVMKALPWIVVLIVIIGLFCLIFSCQLIYNNAYNVCMASDNADLDKCREILNGTKKVL